MSEDSNPELQTSDICGAEIDKNVGNMNVCDECFISSSSGCGAIDKIALPESDSGDA